MLKKIKLQPLELIIILLILLFVYSSIVLSSDLKVLQIEQGKEYINTIEVTLTFNIEYSHMNNIEYIKIGNDKEDLTSWKSFSETKDWELKDGDGERTIYVKFKDEKGNISDIYRDSIFLETTSPKINLKYKRAIIDIPDYNKTVKAEIDSITEVEKVIFTLTSGEKKEKIEFKESPFKIEISPEKWGYSWIDLNIQAETKAGNLGDKEVRIRSVADKELLYEKPDRHRTNLPSDTYMVLDQKGQPVPDNIDIAEGKSNEFNLKMTKVNKNNWNHKGYHLLFKDFKQIPFEKHGDKKITHNYSLTPGDFEHFDIIFEMEKDEEVSFFSLTNYRQTFPGIFIGHDRTMQRAREVLTITEGEKTTIPDGIPQIQPLKFKNLNMIDNISLNSLVPYIISNEEQKNRWERLKTSEEITTPPNRDIYYNNQKNKEEYKFWFEYYNGEDKKEDIIIIPLLNGKQVEIKTDGKKGKVFHSVIEPDTLNYYPLHLNLDNEKRENEIILLVIRTNDQGVWRSSNTTHTYIRTIKDLDFYSYNYSHQVKIKADKEIQNDEKSKSKLKGIIEMKGEIKIYEPHYCQETGITYIDYEIKHEKIEYERQEGLFNFFIGFVQDNLENIKDEKHIASFCQEGKLVDTHSIKTPDGELLTYLGLHKIMLEVILFEVSDELITVPEKNMIQTKKRSVFNNYFDDISMEENFTIINKNNKYKITREAKGQKNKESEGKVHDPFKGEIFSYKENKELKTGEKGKWNIKLGKNKIDSFEGEVNFKLSDIRDYKELERVEVDTGEIKIDILLSKKYD